MRSLFIPERTGRTDRIRRWAVSILIFLAAGGVAAADDGSSDSTANKAAPRPFLANTLATNSASSTFLENHPEVAGPVPGEPPGLSLRPDASAAGTPPDTTPAIPDLSPEIYHLSSHDQPEDLPAHLLVVYNSNDPDSQGLAEYYASRRNIPAERVLAIKAPVTEEITRAQYDDTIREPIVSYLMEKNWMTRQTQEVRVGSRMAELLVARRNDIWAIVLMRGVPLKIAPDPNDNDAMETQPELQSNAAAVDNELALLPVFGLPKGGFVPNIFFDGQISGIKRIGPDLARNMIMVTRLDGPQPSDVRRMIDDSLYAEENRLAGLAVVDSRGFTDVKNGYTTGDVWLRSARDTLTHDGWLVKFDDKPEVLPATDPCNQVAIYLGWYSADPVGPWITPPDRFVRGAIAYHLHSFSAVTVRSPTSNWVGPLIAHGAAATMGNVYEPYLALTPHLDIFTRRLLQGDYFAEAAYASERGLSWMTTVVGDPLYRPFREPLASALANAETNGSDTTHEDWLRVQEVQREIISGKLASDAGSLERALDVPQAGEAEEETLGDLLEKLNDPAAGLAIEGAYQKAERAAALPVDRIRVGLKLAQYYSNHGQDARAMAELDNVRELYPDDAKQFGLEPLVPTTTPGAPTLSGRRAPPPPSDNALPHPPSLPKPTPVPAPH